MFFRAEQTCKVYFYSLGTLQMSMELRPFTRFGAFSVIYRKKKQLCSKDFNWARGVGDMHL